MGEIAGPDEQHLSHYEVETRQTGGALKIHLNSVLGVGLPYTPFQMRGTKLGAFACFIGSNGANARGDFPQPFSFVLQNFIPLMHVRSAELFNRVNHSTNPIIIPSGGDWKIKGGRLFGSTITQNSPLDSYNADHEIGDLDHKVTAIPLTLFRNRTSKLENISP
ncbi:hypothetical protein NPIL_335331 [Nephila pilipes]|uniref:Uncharacterized protein n=1 Tax=Nephila pilipes TaxID=299642 RepID=A0A8X6NBK6_NEPPI|nr:hypothetical protein NPIL_335331 [Nephila pilipes]